MASKAEGGSLLGEFRANPALWLFTSPRSSLDFLRSTFSIVQLRLLYMGSPRLLPAPASIDLQHGQSAS